MAAGSSRPQMLMCYLCGREFGSRSLPIHIPQCEKKWLASEAAKPKSEQKPLPKRPERLNEVMTVGAIKNKASFNEEMYSNWDSDVLDRCQWCGRTFTTSAMKSHAKSCTQECPAKPAGTGLTKASLSNTLASARHTAGGSSSSLESPPKASSHLDFETITGAASLQRPKSRDVGRPQSARRPEHGQPAKRQQSREPKRTTPATTGSSQRYAVKATEEASASREVRMGQQQKAQDTLRKGFYGNVLEERSSRAADNISRPILDESSETVAGYSISFADNASFDRCQTN